MKVATKTLRPSVGSVNRDSGRDKGRGPSGPPSPATPGTPVSSFLSSALQPLEQARPVRAAQAGAGVPAGPGRAGAGVSARGVAGAGHVGTPAPTRAPPRYGGGGIRPNRGPVASASRLISAAHSGATALVPPTTCALPSA